jgi:hypothetical protein
VPTGLARVRGLRLSPCFVVVFAAPRRRIQSTVTIVICSLCYWLEGRPSSVSLSRSQLGRGIRGRGSVASRTCVLNLVPISRPILIMKDCLTSVYFYTRITLESFHRPRQAPTSCVARGAPLLSSVHRPRSRVHLLAHRRSSLSRAERGCLKGNTHVCAGCEHQPSTTTPRLSTFLHHL